MSGVDFSRLRRKSRLPSPPAERSHNLQAPELAPALEPAAATPPDLEPTADPASTTQPKPASTPDTLPRLVTPQAARTPLERKGERFSPPAGHMSPMHSEPPPAVDGRSRRATGRVYPFSTRVASDFRPRLIALADSLGCSMAEALEEAIEALEEKLARPG